MDRIVERVTDTYKEHNEDRFGETKNAYWIMDGALSLNKSKFTDGYSDVIWMVKWWQTYLNKYLDQLDKSIISIVEEGVRQLNKDFSKFTNIENLSKLDRASSGMAIVRINKEIVECFCLGDVEINIKTDQKIVTIVDEKIEGLDNKVMEMIFNNPHRASQIVFNGYTKEELEVLEKHRLKMNAEDGYYILEHEVSAICKALYQEYPLARVKEILMMSDGFSSIYNKYNQLSLEELFITSKYQGLQSVLKRIRNIEEKDLQMTTYKRLRQHDDATAIYIR